MRRAPLSAASLGLSLALSLGPAPGAHAGGSDPSDSAPDCDRAGGAGAGTGTCREVPLGRFQNAHDTPPGQQEALRALSEAAARERAQAADSGAPDPAPQAEAQEARGDE